MTSERPSTLGRREGIETIRDRFAAAWRRDKPPRLEDYLERAASAERSELFRELLAVEIECRRHRDHAPSGQSLSAQEYLDRFPDQHSIIRQRFENIETLTVDFEVASPRGSVRLEIVDGPMSGRQFEFVEHDAFLVGRMSYCAVSLPDDPMISRHQFLLEMNPPEIRLQDLGSRNGTRVNDVRYGGRQRHETPRDGLKRKSEFVDLKDGDQIRVGATGIHVFTKILQKPAPCERPNVTPTPAVAPQNVSAEVPRRSDVREPVPAPRAPKSLVVAPEVAPCEFAESPVAKDSVAKDSVAKDSVAKAGTGQPQGPPAWEVRCSQCGAPQRASQHVGHGSLVCSECRAEGKADELGFFRRLFQRIRKPARDHGPARDQGRPLNGLGKGASAEPPLPKITGVTLAKCLGQGGMGAVFLAHNAANEPVAVKFMLSEIAVNEAACQHFLREIRNLRALVHPNIVQLLESSGKGGAFYFLMEYCGEGSLQSLLKESATLDIATATPIMLDVLAGLGFAHERGYIHRDLKPDNILLARRNGRRTAKIADFGLAKNFERAGFSSMTITGQIKGTPDFMPREQVTRYRYLNPASDVWSIGATFYAMLSGDVPRQAPTHASPVEAILSGTTIPLRERCPKLDPAVVAVIDQALAAEPSDRFQDANQMLAALRAAL